MADRWNPSANGTLGLEWLIDTPIGSYVLDSASKSYCQYMPGSTLSGGLASSVAVYGRDGSPAGPGKFGAEMYSAPLAVPPGAAYDTDYPGTDTGADFTSVQNTGAAWVTQAGGAATFASVSPGVDDTTYLKNVNGWEGFFCRMWLRGANATQTAGKRILSVEIHVRIRVLTTQQAGPTLQGAFIIGGQTYLGGGVTAPYNAGYQDVTLMTQVYNPATGLPWTLPSLNNLITTGGTDSWGFQGQWGGYAADTVRVSSLYLKVKWVPEDRIGYAYGDVSIIQFQTWNAFSVPNLITTQDSNLDVNTGTTGSWTANANTTLSNDTLDRGLPWTRSLKMLAGAAGTFGATSTLYPCIGGKSYSAACYTNATAARLTSIGIQFTDAGGVILSTVTGSTKAGTGAFQAGVTVGPTVAPANATQMRLIIQTTATAGAQTCFAQGIVLSLDQIATKIVVDSYAGGLTPMKVDGGTEQSFYGHGVPEYVTFRRISGAGSLAFNTFGPGASSVGMPLGMYSYRPTLQDAAGALLAVGSPLTDCTQFISNKLHNVEAVNGPDPYYTQPYAGRATGQVDSSNTVTSQITLPVATFGAVRLIVSAAVEVPQAPLSIKLKRTSDNVQAGGTAVINPTDLLQIVPTSGGAASRTTPQLYIVTIPTPGANTAVQYYLEFSSGATVGQGWNVYALGTSGYTNDSVSIETLSFGGTTDIWNSPINVRSGRDGMCCVQTVPTAPAGFGVVVS